MNLELVRTYENKMYASVLIAQFISGEIAYPLLGALKEKYDDTNFELRPITLRNSPRWIVGHVDKGVFTTVAQFEPEFLFLATALVTVLNGLMPSAQFHIHEYKGAQQNVALMAPLYVKGKMSWQQIGEKKIVIPNGGKLQ